MLIWRGAGFLAAVYVGLAMILFLGAASSVLSESLLPLSAALGLVLAAVATWLTGTSLNQTRPRRAYEEWHSARVQQLDHLVATGGFQVGPGQPLPRSPEEARQQADWLLAQEEQQFRRRYNVHTLFFVPMQYIAYLLGAIALVLLVVGVAGVLTG